MFSVAVVGATGAVGQEMLKTLEKHDFPCGSLRLMASERSAGKQFPFHGEMITVENLDTADFTDVDIVLSSAGASISKQFVPRAVEQGALVIDNTSAFRMDEDVPLVVPEVNPEAAAKHKGIIANPNCSTIQMVVVLNPIHQAVGIKRVVCSTYQAASGAGQAAMDELAEHSKAILDGGTAPEPKEFAHELAFNCIPHIDVFLENGYTKEEMKMINETKKIMSAPDMRLTMTTVRVPVMRCHSESVNVETDKKLTAAECRELLAKSPGIIVQDDPENKVYPLPRNLAGSEPTYVGRIREDESIDNGLNMWIVADQLLKGAALNAVQIAEQMIQDGLIKPKKAASAT